LKDTLAQRLFDKIKHGDETHMEWLAKELEDFFKAKITR
jgi:bacterioferritin (cytochrome b1)